MLSWDKQQEVNDSSHVALSEKILSKHVFLIILTCSNLSSNHEVSVQFSSGHRGLGTSWYSIRGDIKLWLITDFTYFLIKTKLKTRLWQQQFDSPSTVRTIHINSGWFSLKCIIVNHAELRATRPHQVNKTAHLQLFIHFISSSRWTFISRS